MIHLLLPILLQIPPLQPRSFDVNPAVNPWFLLTGAIIAGASVVYLYTAQQRIAPRAIVNSLTAIRMLLVLLVMGLLLGPVRQWVHTRHSNGTLFVLLDQSASMKQTDPQATDTERLAWADALGYLPADLRPGSAVIGLNQLIAQRQDLDALRADAQHLQNDSTFAGHLADARDNLEKLAGDLEQNNQIKQLAPDVPVSLHDSAILLGKSLVQLHDEHRIFPWHWIRLTGAMLAIVFIALLWIGRKHIQSQLLARAVPAICMALLLVSISLVGWAALRWPVGDDAVAVDRAALQEGAQIPWDTLRETLGKASDQLIPAANSESREFLDRHGSDPRVADAIAKVKRMNRAQLAYAALSNPSTHRLKSLTDMLQREDVKLVPFGDHAGITTPEKGDLMPAIHQILRDPKAQSTDISSALQFVSEQMGEDATVLIVSDGRQNIGTEPEAAARFLSSHGTRVFTLTIGSHELARDAAVDHVDAPDWVYADDQVVISPVIRLDALRGQDVVVQLRRDDQVVDTRTIRARSDQEKQRLRLTDHPPQDGVYNYSVVIQPVPDEAIATNNTQSVRVAVKKQQLNVLLIEDEPGWEYQFLRNYLARDHRVKLQVVLLSPGRIEKVQSPAGTLAAPSREDGKIDAQILPATREQWSAFDIVIMGDIPPEKFPADQQTLVTSALRDGSIKALILLAGQRNMPARYAGAPLADVIPVELSASPWTADQLADELRHGFTPALGTDGIGSVLGQMSDDAGTNAQIWANLPLWYWHSEQTTARPGASVIWSIQDSAASNTTPPPDSIDAYQTIRQHALLASMNAGLGRVLYLASPQTWRFRYVQTPGDDSHIEDVHRRFWGQVVRWAMGDDLPAGGKFVRFGTNKRSYIGGEPVIVTARVLGEDFVPLPGAAFKILATRADNSPAGETIMTEAKSEGAGVYRGSLTLPAGTFNLHITGGEPQRLLNSDSSVEASQKSLTIDVAPDTTVEDKDVNADPARMASIATAGDGVALDGCCFDVLAAHLPVVDHTDTQIAQAGLFSNPDDVRTQISHWIFFGLFVILITAEWILRKRGGLV